MARGGSLGAGDGVSGSSGGRVRGGTRKGSPLGWKRGGCPGMFPAGDGFACGVPSGSLASGSTRHKETRPVTGIQFITDAKGRKTAAVIDLKKHRALWEDIEDVLVSRSRRHEKRIPLEKVKAGLIACGKLHG